MRQEFTTAKVDYHDIRFFLVAIPFINALNYYLTYHNISWSAHTLLTFTIDTLEGFSAWWLVRMIIVGLDQRMPYAPRPLRRILIQLLLTAGAGLGIIILITEILNRIIKGGPMPSSFYRFDIFIFLIWFFVINGIYVGIYYYRQWAQAEHLREQDRKIRMEGFSVRHGRQRIHISFAEAAGIYVEGDYAILVTNKGKKHLLDQSLDKVEKSLPVEMFFRLNRQYILNRNRISGFEPLDNGKISAILIPGEHLPDSIQISRTKAPAFRLWLRGQID
jgi:LytTr DNA-binding domain